MARRLRASLLIRLSLALALSSVPLVAHANPCGSLQSELDGLDPRVSGIIELVKVKVTPDLVSGKQTPSWQNFEDLSLIIGKIHEVKSSLASKGELEAAMRLVAEAAPEIMAAPAFQKLKEAGDAEAPSGDTYAPTEYELKRLYQELLLDLNRELPRSMAVKFPRLNQDARRKSISERTEALSKRAREVFDGLASTTGASSYEQVERDIAANPKFAPMLELLKTGQIELSIRRPERGRWWVPKVGFQNQFVTGSSRGANDPDSRNRVEGSSLQMTAAEYAKEDAETKPKYGSVRPSPTSGLEPANTDGMYGEDVYILKEEAIKDRLTWSQFDSRYRQLNISSLNEQKADAWDRTFIPWENNALMAPFMVAGAAARPGTVGGTGTPAEAPFKLSVSIPSNNYLETQIFGQLDLSHVKAFEFTYQPPEGAFLAELQRHGIEIRDGRTWPPKPWKK